MRLPNAERSIVEREKLIEYLLNPAHPDNGGKAHFFINLDFLPQEWLVLARAFKALAVDSLVTEAVASPHGIKYILDGAIKGPFGKSGMIRTI